MDKGADPNTRTAMDRTALSKACWNGQFQMVELLLTQPNVDLSSGDNQGRTALHMAVWGQYGGRLRKKASAHPTDSPECAILLLKAGADPNAEDVYGVAPLGTACGTGGARCIDMLVKHGATVNHLDKESTAALHQCFFRGNIDCLRQLIKHKPDTSIRRKGALAIDSVFRDDMDDILDCLLNDKDIQKFTKGDPNMSATKENMERLLH